MTATIFSWIVLVIAKTGYAGVVGLMALESACLPLPSEVIMPFAGYLVSTGRFNLIMIGTAGAIGCNLGSTAAYFVGANGGRAAIIRWGKYAFFGAGELEQVDRFFIRFGSMAVLIGRLLPVIRSFISLPSGVARMPLARFQIYTFIGSMPWCLALAFLGMKLGDEWNSNTQVQAFFHRFDWIIVAVLAAASVFYVYRRWHSAKP